MRQASEYSRDLIQSCEPTGDWRIGVERGVIGPATFCVTEGGSGVARIQQGNVVSGELHLPDLRTVWCTSKGKGEEDTITTKEFAQQPTNQESQIILWYVQRPGGGMCDPRTSAQEKGKPGADLV